jgi:hypothetical protein
MFQLVAPLAASLSMSTMPTFPPTSASDAECRPGDHAPIGVMDVQCPMDKQWVLSFRSMYTHSQGEQSGTHSISIGDVFAQGFTQAPTSMSMWMQELGAMYAMSDRLSIMASVPWVDNTMKMELSTGEKFSMRASGVGDVNASLAYTLWSSGDNRVALGANVSFPTGSIHQRQDTPGCPDCKLEYPMQLGSGTYDLVPSIAYHGRADGWTFGAQAEGRIHLDHNDVGYALGDRFDASTWVQREWTERLSSSLRFSGARWGNVRGSDPELDPTMSPTNDATKQGGTRVDVALGANWLPFGGRLQGSVIGIEAGVPIAQDLSGPQPAVDWFATLGILISF